MASVKIKCPLCDNIFTRTVKQINAVVRRSGRWACKACVTTARNKANAKPIGSRRLNSKGYVMIKTAAGYQREHVLVASEKIGRPLVPGEVAHHVNRNKTDNSPANIEVITHGEHSSLHNMLRARQPREQHRGQR